MGEAAPHTFCLCFLRPTLEGAAGGSCLRPMREGCWGRCRIHRLQISSGEAAKFLWRASAAAAKGGSRHAVGVDGRDGDRGPDAEDSSGGGGGFEW